MAFASLDYGTGTLDEALPFEPMARTPGEPVTVFVVIRRHPHGGIYLLVLPDVAEELTNSYCRHLEDVTFDRAYIGRQSDGSPFCLRWDAVEAIY